jgi:hypothetical protein
MRARRHSHPDHNLTNGPGKLCIAMGIDRQLDGADLLGDQVWLEDFETCSSTTHRKRATDRHRLRQKSGSTNPGASGSVIIVCKPQSVRRNPRSKNKLHRRRRHLRIRHRLSSQKLHHSLFDLRRREKQRIAVNRAFDDHVRAVCKSLAILFRIADRRARVQSAADEQHRHVRRNGARNASPRSGAFHSSQISGKGKLKISSSSVPLASRAMLLATRGCLSRSAVHHVRHRRTEIAARLIEPNLCGIREVAFRRAIKQRWKPRGDRGADIVRDDVLQHKLVHDDFDLELRARDRRSRLFPVEHPNDQRQTS